MDKQILIKRLISHREESVRIETIDLATGGRYGLQNREDSEVPEDIIDDYTSAWLRDDPFPPVILWQEKPGSKYFPIDGYTRCTTAIRAGREEILAVIVDCDEATARQLCIEANSRHGRRASRDFLIRGAVALTEEGMSVREAAARTSLPEAVISERRLVARAQSRARQNHVTGIDNLPDSVLEKLANVGLDSVFTAALELARDAKLKTGKVEDLAKAIRQGRSEADQLAIIEGERAELSVSAADDQLAKIRQPYSRFIGSLSKLRSYDLSEVVKAAYAAGTTKDELHDQFNRLREIAAGLESMIDDIYGDHAA